MKELRYINKFFIKYRGKLFIGILITIVARVFSLVMPEYIQYSVDAIEPYLLNETKVDRDELAGLLTGIAGQLAPATKKKKK